MSSDRGTGLGSAWYAQRQVCGLCHTSDPHGGTRDLLPAGTGVFVVFMRWVGWTKSYESTVLHVAERGIKGLEPRKAPRRFRSRSRTSQCRKIAHIIRTIGARESASFVFMKRLKGKRLVNGISQLNR